MPRGSVHSNVVERGTPQEGHLAPRAEIKTDSPFVPNYGFVQHHQINVPAANVGFYDLLHSLGQQEFQNYIKIEQTKELADANLALLGFFNQYKSDSYKNSQDGVGYVDNFYKPYDKAVAEISKGLSSKAADAFKAQAQQNRQIFVNSLFDLEQADRLVHTRDSQMKNIGSAQQMVFIDGSTYPAALEQVERSLAVIKPTMGAADFSKFSASARDLFYAQMVLGRIHEDQATNAKDSIILNELKARKQEWVSNLRTQTYSSLFAKAEGKITSNALQAAKKAKLDAEFNYLRDSEQAQAIKQAIAQDSSQLSIQPLYAYTEKLAITNRQVSSDLKKFYAKQLKNQETVVADYETVNQLVAENKSLLGTSPTAQEHYLQYRVQKEFTDANGKLDVVRMANETASVPTLRDSPLVENILIAHANNPDPIQKYNGLVAANIYMISASNLGKKMPEQLQMAAVKFRYAGLSAEEVKNGTPNAIKVMGEIDGILNSNAGRQLKELPAAFKAKNVQSRHLEIIDNATQIAVNRAIDADWEKRGLNSVVAGIGASWQKDWLAHEYKGRLNPALIALAKKSYEAGFVETGDAIAARKYAEEAVANSIKVSKFNGRPEIFLGGLLVENKGVPDFENKLRTKITEHIENLRKGGLPISIVDDVVEYHGTKFRVVVRNAADFQNRLNVGLVDESIDYDTQIFLPLPDKADGSGFFFFSGE